MNLQKSKNFLKNQKAVDMNLEAFNCAKKIEAISFQCKLYLAVNALFCDFKKMSDSIQKGYGCDLSGFQCHLRKGIQSYRKYTLK